MRRLTEYVYSLEILGSQTFAITLLLPMLGWWCWNCRAMRPPRLSSVLWKLS